MVCFSCWKFVKRETSARETYRETYRETFMNAANNLTNKILDFLYRQGAYAFRASSVGIYDQRRGVYRTAAKKGVADILACHHGQFIAIEVKIGKDRLSPEQEGFLMNISAVGGNTFVATTFETFREAWIVQYPDCRES